MGIGPQPGGGAGAGPQGEGGYGWAGCWAGQGGGGPLDQVLGPMPRLLGVTRGPLGGRGRAGAGPSSARGDLSASSRWRALTMPTGMEEPATRHGVTTSIARSTPPQ